MTTKLKKQQAYELVLAEVSLRKIANQLNISRSTVERWSVREDWMFQRAVTWNQRRQKATEDHIKKSKHLSTALSDFVFEHLMHEIGWYKAVENGSVPEKARRFRPRAFRQLVNAFWSATYGEATYALMSCQHMNDVVREELTRRTQNKEMAKKASDFS